MRKWRISRKAASSLLVGLGLLVCLAAAGGAISDAQKTASPFDQVTDNGARDAFVPLIAPPAQPGRPPGAPTLRPPATGHTSGAPTSLPTSGAPALYQATAPAAATAAALPSATLVANSIPDRISIPAISLDAPALPAKLRDIEYQGKTYQQWVAPDLFAAGWLATSATLGVPGNTVFSGHNNLHGEVFGHLQDLKVGDLILVYSGGREFAYVIVLKMILPERFEPLAVRLKNAEWIQPSQDERLTLVTCWPYESNTHRLIIVATPAPVTQNQIANNVVIPRLTPHPPLSWMATLSVPSTDAPGELSATSSP